MPARVVTLVIGCAVACLVRGLAAAQSGPGPADRPASTPLIGVWKLDRAKTKDDQDVWKRRLDGLRAQQAASAPLNADPFGSRQVRPPVINDWQLRAAMRDLLEVAEQLSFRMEGESITITDDLERALKFATKGAKEKRQVAATPFMVRTRWNGAALTQDITVAELGMTVIYLPSEDGREMLVSISVDKPTFQPPLKNIMRVYTRAN
jgi:hypothetical protein